MFLSRYSFRFLLVWLAAYLLVKLWGSGTFTKGFLLFSVFGYAAVLLYMTLLSRGAHEGVRIQLELLWELRQAFLFEAGELRVQNSEYVWLIANNILLFVPLGVLVSECCDAYGKTTFLRVMATGCLVSAFLEISQLVFRIGLFELDDILNNTIGTILGFCFFVLAKRLTKILRCRSRA